MIYGYARISTKKQSIERQIRNILEYNSDTVIFKEAYTGTKIDGRKKFNQLLKIVKPGDTIVFDSVSRMSRNTSDGIELYFELYNKNINLIFLKERYIDTEVFRSAVQQTIGMTGNEIADIYIEATNKVIRLLAEKQIEKAFEQSEKEVQDLRQRTKEGIRTVKTNNSLISAGVISGDVKQIGQKKGSKLTTKKSIATKKVIVKHSKDFDGTLSDIDCMKLTGLARNTYYKYKKELRLELAE